MHTTEEIIHAVTLTGCLEDLKHNLAIGNTGGAKFIVRACLGLDLANSDWINLGVILDLHDAIQA